MQTIEGIQGLVLSLCYKVVEGILFIWLFTLRLC